MIQIETFMQVIIEVQVPELCDAAVALHEEQGIEVLGEVEVLETHEEAEDNLKEVHAPTRPGILHGVRPPPVPPPGHLPNPGGLQDP